MHALAGGVTIGATAAGAVHTKGVKRCASPWACPVCAPTIAERRANEIDTAVSEWLEQGGTVYMVTATLAHQLGDDLDGLLELLQRAWSRTWRWEAPHASTRQATAGQITNADRVRPDWYRGQLRTIEVTYGINGWHPHIHSLVWLPPGHTAAGLFELRKRWADSVDKNGGSCNVDPTKRALHSIGWQLSSVTTSDDVARYVTKVEGGWSAGREIAKADQKRKGVTPWMLLEDAVAGDQRAATLYKIYEKATRGRKRIVSTPGLVALVEDEEAAEAKPVDELTVVIQVRADHWRQLLKMRRAAILLSDVADMATGSLDEWTWPDAWLTTRRIAA